MDDVSGVAVMDFHRCHACEILDAYQDLALLLSAANGRGAVLLRTGNEDADLHYALRDIVHTAVRILGKPLQARVALVGSSYAIRHVCRAMQPALRALGCELRLFRQESEATCWLLAIEQPVILRAVACAAIPESGRRSR